MNLNHVYNTAMQRRRELLKDGLVRHDARMILWFHPEDRADFLKSLSTGELAGSAVEDVLYWRGFQVCDAPEVTDEGTILLKMDGDVLCRIPVKEAVQ